MVYRRRQRRGSASGASREGSRAPGRRFERVAEVAIFRFRDGKIVHAWSLEDTLGRLQQLGLA